MCWPWRCPCHLKRAWWRPVRHPILPPAVAPRTKWRGDCEKAKRPPAQQFLLLLFLSPPLRHIVQAEVRWNGTHKQNQQWFSLSAAIRSFHFRGLSSSELAFHNDLHFHSAVVIFVNKIKNEIGRFLSGYAQKEVAKSAASERRLRSSLSSNKISSSSYTTLLCV